MIAVLDVIQIVIKIDDKFYLFYIFEKMLEEIIFKLSE